TDMLGDTQFLEFGASSLDATISAQSSASPTSAHVDWSVRSATGTHAAVYRKAPGGRWTAAGEGEVSASGHLAYNDAAVTAGATYWYKRVVGSQRGRTFGGETNVTVPTTTGVDPAAAVFALRGATPNPAIDRLSVTFSLASDAPASLTLVDVAGRAIVDREVGSLGAGRHRLDFAAPGSIPPGLHFLRPPPAPPLRA